MVLSPAAKVPRFPSQSGARASDTITFSKSTSPVLVTVIVKLAVESVITVCVSGVLAISIPGLMGGEAVVNSHTGPALIAPCSSLATICQ